MKCSNMTIADVAEALGVSKTTVSRAISGKGRIGEDTRKRVLEYVEKNDYRPNVIARGLAQSKTFNLCAVMPENYTLSDLPLFQQVLAGVQEIAECSGYDILLCTGREDDIANLERILRNQKVDGAILLRTFLKDRQIAYLMDRGLPFVTAGSTDYPGVRQVDLDHRGACQELTSILLMRRCRRIALIGGHGTCVITRNRYQSFVQAHSDLGLEPHEDLIFMNRENRAQIDRAVEDALERGADCILCMDDTICDNVLRKLRTEKVRVPDEIRVASLYNSTILDNNTPSVTTLSFDARELGRRAAQNLLAQIAGEPTAEKTLLPYEVVLKESTK